MIKYYKYTQLKCFATPLIKMLLTSLTFSLIIQIHDNIIILLLLNFKYYVFFIIITPMYLLSICLLYSKHL